MTNLLPFGRRGIAALASGVALAQASRPAAAQPAAASGPAQALVSTEWLTENLRNPQVRVIEVSVNPGLFERGHIPGATNVSWHRDLVDTVRRDIASREQIQNLLRRAGVQHDSTVVLYGDNNNWFAAWGAWVLDIYGVRDVRLLDGGRRKWEAEGRQVSNRPVTHQATTLELPAQPNLALRARLADVVPVAQNRAQEVRLLDIRSPDEFSGKIFAPPGFQELAIRAGHIPGAVNVPWAQAVRPDGTFKSVDELRALYANVGIDGSRPVIVYCRIGERSSHSWFALKRLLGYQNVRQYDGSWTEYGNSVGVPIENPAGTIWGAT
ncbi:sulfurtransferase [Rhodovarius crocodyli]|uniref:Sulfurtransferase n=1 Tax=Rhodovarius crocodyli TaxID=1979269 RepID=A0A437M225_9PROT|nr:sulfurtransferase [Rhodovarius crocodyli]RVT91662.1 sulfurtransferase [Rhodovarius crocodyli]